MLIGRGAHAVFRLWPNSAAFGNKEFDDPADAAEERALVDLLLRKVNRPVLPPIVRPWTAPNSIAMMRMHMNLDHAVHARLLSPRILQRIVYAVTDLLLSLTDQSLLMMDTHIGNVLLQFDDPKDTTSMPRVYLNDPGFLHDFSDGSLPAHVRRIERFDPHYDLALFSYSLLGCLRQMGCTDLPITPLSERELIAFKPYIAPPHQWALAVGRYPYAPDFVDAVVSAKRSAPVEHTASSSVKRKKER